MHWHRQRWPEIDDRDAAADEFQTLRAALDELRLGVVLLDAELRATFVNRTFRRMWRLPDAQAESHPAFVALMYHGRDTRAYAVPEHELDAYVAERVALVRAGDTRPVDLWLASGEVVRFHCTVLPDGGRLLTYDYITEMVGQDDELALLRAALDNVAPGVLLLDRHLNARFMNKAARRLWKVDDSAAAQPSFAQLLHAVRIGGPDPVSPEQLDSFVAAGVPQVRAAESAPRDLRLEDGRVVRTQCTSLPDGGRMLTYTDVSDLARQAEEAQRLATLDPATGLLNRPQFHARASDEWDRFHRYHRPLALIVLDVDGFKKINERHGHDAGDRVVAHVAELCARDRRSLDLVGRVGGDEFALLLPETDLDQAEAVAERIREAAAQHPVAIGGTTVPLTVSVGVAGATQSMAGAAALMREAEQALARAKASGRNLTRRAAVPTSEEYHRAAE
jgi:diguanylate cyclase (GGDEF)-like protein